MRWIMGHIHKNQDGEQEWIPDNTNIKYWGFLLNSKPSGKQRPEDKGQPKNDKSFQKLCNKVFNQKFENSRLFLEKSQGISQSYS